MKHTFFARFALPILMLVFFTVPFALRGARMAFTTMKNDVKDWLPSEFEETTDLEWFRDNFLGEQFVLITWPGCTADDTRFKLLVDKLENELIRDDDELAADPASQAALVSDELAEEGEADAEANAEEAALAAVRSAKAAQDRELQRARQLGDRLALSTTGDYCENWGGRQEKWLQGEKDSWYFITPDGELYRWDGGNNLLGWASRRLEKTFTGKNQATGELIATLGEKPLPGSVNPYWADPRKITGRFFKTITTGPHVLEQLAGPQGGLWPRGNYSDEERSEIAHQLALERLTGALFGPDGRQTCLIVTLSDVGRRDLKRVLGRPMLGKPEGRLLQIARESGLDYEDLRLGGPPVDNVAIDEEGSITLVRLIGWSLLLGVGLAYISFRSIKITIMIFFVGGVSAVMGLSFVWYANDFVDAIVMSMPSLVYVLGLTGAVHMLTYYRHHAREHGLEGAAEATIVHTWKPILLAQVTSAIGLLSLLTSELSPIRKFGWYSALGTLATVLVMYLYLPSALQLWPPGYHKRRTAESSPLAEWWQRVCENFWRTFSGYVVRNHRWIAPTIGVFVIVMAFGATKLKTNVHLLKMFDANAKIIQDYAWLEQNLGKLVPMELVVRVSPQIMALPTAAAEEADQEEAAPPAEPSLARKLVEYNFLERLEIADRVQQAIEAEFGAQGQDILGRGMSAATFAPPIPEPGVGLRNPRGVMNRKLEQHRHEFLASDYLRIDQEAGHEGSELWRISLRLGALNNVDYGLFVNDLKAVVEPILAAVNKRDALLTKLAEVRGEEGLTGARVLVVGLSEPGEAPTAADTAPPGAMASAGSRLAVRNVSATAGELDPPPAAPQAKAGNQLGIHLSYEKRQEQLFAGMLATLLENRGFRTTARAKSQLEFLDAQGLVDDEGKPLSRQALAEKLAGYDCVLVAKELDGLDMSLVQKHGRSAVDARDFRFDPYSNQATAARRGDAVQVIYTGIVPIVYKAQRTLLESLVSSTQYAFVSIALCLMLLLRRGRLRPWNFMNVRAGLIAMFPNMFPLCVVFGAIGYLGIEVDIGSMMTASIAIGVAVDDTIHYLEYFRKQMRLGKTRNEAIVAAYEHTGVAIVETMLIAGLGLSVFAFSTFTPTQRFGTMMLMMLCMGALGELTWMPAILAGPLGKYFEPILDKKAPPAEEETPALALAATHGPSPRMQLDAPHTAPRGSVRKDAAH